MAKARGGTTFPSCEYIRINTRRQPFPIPGTAKLHRLEENLGAAEMELMADDLREIEGALSRITVQGHRNSEGSQRMIDR